MPTDFVFVDLSPVKNDEIASTTPVTSASSTSTSPASTFTTSDIESPLLDNSNDSISSIGSEDNDSIFSSFDQTAANGISNFDFEDYMQDKNTNFEDNFGLGIMNIDYNQAQQFNQLESPQPQPQPQQAQTPFQFQFPTATSNQAWNLFQQQIAFQQFLQFQSQFQSQFQYPQAPQVSQTNVESVCETQLPNSNKRSKSTTLLPTKKQTPSSNSGIQFKTYKGPSLKKSKPTLKHHNSEPITLPQTPKEKVDLDDFMNLNNQITSFLQDSKKDANTTTSNNEICTFSPASEISESEDVEYLQKPINLDSSLFDDSIDFLNLNEKSDEFDLNAFISI